MTVYLHRANRTQYDIFLFLTIPYIEHCKIQIRNTMSCQTSSHNVISNIASLYSSLYSLLLHINFICKKDTTFLQSTPNFLLPTAQNIHPNIFFHYLDCLVVYLRVSPILQKIQDKNDITDMQGRWGKFKSLMHNFVSPFVTELEVQGEITALISECYTTNTVSHLSNLYWLNI